MYHLNIFCIKSTNKYLYFLSVALKCKSDIFGDGYPGFIAKADCGEGKIGEITAECLASGLYGNIQDNCVLKEVQELFLQSEVICNLITKINNISITFNTSNDTLGNPKCVFWNFRLFDGLGGWDDEGCLFVNQKTGTVSCNCNHLTSFSILMSPSAPNIPALTYITYCGLAISMISLIICLIIEAIVWGEIRNHSTSFLRHVSSINIALSLLIADIWFIIGAGKLESQSACLAVTFFIHFFYLAMFFWMLAAALLLFSRTILVLSQGLSDRTMVGIGFTLGYGAPLIIAAITIGVTVPSKNYIQEKDVCWLRWKESRTLLAFVIPALAIVLINLVILVTVLFQILRSRLRVNAAQADEKHILLVIAKSVAVLTPLFGLTWGLGVGTMLDPNNKGLHIAFAFFNSLQVHLRLVTIFFFTLAAHFLLAFLFTKLCFSVPLKGFFILVFGTLLDKKVHMPKHKMYS
uniref:Adhesion G protein-coupled receptor F7 n=1 Tax=Oryzias melastigma TaxID=30732 RepID=A0A3B3DGR7_ORYME